MKKNVTPGKTPAEISVSMIDQDLKDGISKPEMATKYGIKPWEVDEMFKHPLLKGRRPSRKKTLSFSFVDDMTEGNDELIDETTLEDKQFEKALDSPINENGETLRQTLVDPNQVTLEDAIDEALETVEEVKDQMQETQEAILDMLSPTEYETPEETLLKAAQDTENEVIEELNLEEEEDGTFEL